MKLANKTALVTGGGSGIGRAIAECFAREGARVAIVGRTPEKLDRVRREAGEGGRRILTRAVEVSDQAGVEKSVEWAHKELGSLDILVNNAGINVPNRAFKDLTIEAFERVIDTNLKGAYYFIHAVLPKMRTQGGGLIINISSIAGIGTFGPSGGAYTASKYGLSGLSLILGREEAANGIRSCMICPGEVNTPIMEQRPVVPDAEHRAQMLQPEDLAEAALLMATLHPRATIPELIMTPTLQKYS